ncbi:MAG: orotidine-5'-phosphate decarboxylase [Proteobacteria bacterium]|nr:orotidine-5'-phosphate decarboxylase [Pseudomonadota bacterium]
MFGIWADMNDSFSTSSSSVLCESMRQRLSRVVGLAGSQLCVGVDVRCDVAERFAALSSMNTAKVSLTYLLEWLGEHVLIATIQQGIRCVKFQMAYFEAHGSAGIGVLESLVALAQSHDCFVILDGKRGDIASSMEAYGRMAFDHFDADALTINPYMGADVWQALEPWFVRGKGVFVLWRTSNASGDLIQSFPQCLSWNEASSQHHTDHREKSEASSESLYGHIWSLLYDKPSCLQQGMRAQDSIGLVLGATKMGALGDMDPAVYASLGDIPLLLPGLGKQGGAVDKTLNKPWHIYNVSRALYEHKSESEGEISPCDVRPLDVRPLDVRKVLGHNIAHYRLQLKIP